jgi:hypothetical protein
VLDWGVPGDPTDDPLLHHDCETSCTSEEITVDKLTTPGTYSVVARYFDDHHRGSTTVRMEVFRGARNIFNGTTTLTAAGQEWLAFDIIIAPPAAPKIAIVDEVHQTPADLLLGGAAVSVAAPDGSGSFLKITKRQLSGKTGQPVASVEVFYEGQTWIKDGADRILARARVSPAELAAFDGLAADPALFAATPECGRPAGADLPAGELIIQQQWKTVSFRFAASCRLPEVLDKLRAMLDDVERKYLSRAR